MMGFGLVLMLALMVGGVGQTWDNTRSRARQGVVGDWVYNDPTRRWGSGLNSSPQAAQVTTVTMTDQGDDDDVIITINGVNVSYATGTGKSLATMGAEFAAAINAEPLVRGQVRATFDTATLTLTGLTPGLVFTVSIASDPDSVLSAVTAVTAADTADPVHFGRAVIRTGTNTSESETLVAEPYAALFTAQVITVTPTYVSTAVIEASVYEIRDGERIFVKAAIFASATDLATTTAGIRAALNTALPANTLLVTDSATTVIFTAEVPGTEWDVEFHHQSTGASSPTFATAYTTGPSDATSIHRAWRGIALYSPADEAATVAGDEGQYAANAGVKYASRGVVWVTSAQTPGVDDTVYVETVAGATQGRFYTDSSATRIAMGRRKVRWERDGLVSGDSLAAIRLEA